jgi:hypothetical protein
MPIRDLMRKNRKHKTASLRLIHIVVGSIFNIQNTYTVMSENIEGILNGTWP